MAEWHEKCSYYPDCTIHRGMPKPKYFTTGDIRDMVTLKEQGDTMRTIAAEFGTSHGAVSQIIRHHRNGAPQYHRREPS